MNLFFKIEGRSDIRVTADRLFAVGEPVALPRKAFVQMEIDRLIESRVEREEATRLAEAKYRDLPELEIYHVADGLQNLVMVEGYPVRMAVRTTLVLEIDPEATAEANGKKKPAAEKTSPKK